MPCTTTAALRAESSEAMHGTPGTAWLVQQQYRTINLACDLTLSVVRLRGPAKKAFFFSHLQRATCDSELLLCTHASSPPAMIDALL